jgi:hypothetical protein
VKAHLRKAAERRQVHLKSATCEVMLIAERLVGATSRSMMKTLGYDRRAQM